MYAHDLGGDLAVIDKRRENSTTAVATRIIGSVKDKDVLMFDDMITTAGTICSAAQLVRDQGARSVRIGATHGIFAPPAYERLSQAPIDEIVVTDTIPHSDEISKLKNLKILTVATLLGEAIGRIHQHKSISDIFIKYHKRG
jgi:ribose-phosphate pyrophosphokinase